MEGRSLTGPPFLVEEGESRGLQAEEEAPQWWWVMDEDPLDGIYDPEIFVPFEDVVEPENYKGDAAIGNTVPYVEVDTDE